MALETKHVILGTIGVGIVLGLVALSRKKAEPGALSSPEEPGALPSALPGEPRSTVLTGETLKFRQGGRYRARIDTTGGGEPFAPSSTREAIGQALYKLGFRDLIVYMAKDELVGWAEPDINDAPNARWFFGRWGVPDLEVSRPAAITSIRLTSART